MADSTTTRPSLLLRLRDAHDREAWEEFVEVYAPLVYGFARKHGFQDADAADLTQEVLQAVATSIGRLDYDPRRGTFRGWLFTLVRNRLRNALARRPRECRGSGGSSAQVALESWPDPDEGPLAVWEQDCERRLFAWAAELVRGEVQDSTWQAFWLTAVEGRSGKEAATLLGLTTAAVYLAKRRILLRLKEEIARLQGD
jgi:RNA polymerase sigma factor (sigma-70 family)